LRKRKHLNFDVKKAQDEEFNRSTMSRAEDPILPDDPIEDISKILLKQGVIITHQQIFFYKIHGTEDSLKSDCDYPELCWSLFFKYGKKAIKIWEFHRFSDEALNEVYPDGLLEDSLSEDSDLKGPSHTDIDPMESMCEFIEETVRRTLAFITNNSNKAPEFWLQEFKE
jgi:hypothetical protein